MSLDDRRALQALEVRLRSILPAEYQDSYQDLQPVSMGSAGLKFGDDGKVAWNEIWATFCDLAMAGGPPHKGTLLEPAGREEIDARPDSYQQVTEEICRGITMVTGLEARLSPVPGWVRVACHSEGMAGWLVRAIVMENVAARSEGSMLDLPAAPHFRLEKEIKNVVTAVAKTCHYWVGHIPGGQQRAIAAMFAEMSEDAPLIEPELSNYGAGGDAREKIRASMIEIVQRDTGLRPSSHRYAGWLGVECPSVRAAVWMTRAMVVNNVLSRREATVLFMPVNPASDPDGHAVARTFGRVHALAVAGGVVPSFGA
jgi:sirohydrochlorin cobaltochelatase